MARLIESPGALLLRLHLRVRIEQLRRESRRLPVRARRLPVLFRERLTQAFESFSVTGEAVFNSFVLRLDESFTSDKWRGKQFTTFLVFLHYFLSELPGMLV